MFQKKQTPSFVEQRARSYAGRFGGLSGRMQASFRPVRGQVLSMAITA